MRGDGWGVNSVEHGLGNVLRGSFSDVTGLRREATDTMVLVDEGRKWDD